MRDPSEVAERLAEFIEEGELFLNDDTPPDLRDVNASAMYRISAHDCKIIVAALRAAAELRKARLFDFMWGTTQNQK